MASRSRNKEMLEAISGKKRILVFLTSSLFLFSFLWLSMKLQLSLPVLDQTGIELRSGSRDWLKFTEGSEEKTPWPGDTECQHHKVRFLQKHSRPPTALVSFPGSGNSWLRWNFSREVTNQFSSVNEWSIKD